MASRGFGNGFEKTAIQWTPKRLAKAVNGIMARTGLPRNKHNLSLAEEAVNKLHKGVHFEKPERGLARNALSAIRTLQVKMPKKQEFKRRIAKHTKETQGEYATNSLIGITQKYPKLNK